MDKTPTTLLKGILYKWYTFIGDKDTYTNVSKQSKDYLLKISNGILEEGYELREQTLERIN